MKLVCLFSFLIIFMMFRIVHLVVNLLWYNACISVVVNGYKIYVNFLDCFGVFLVVYDMGLIGNCSRKKKRSGRVDKKNVGKCWG